MRKKRWGDEEEEVGEEEVGEEEVGGEEVGGGGGGGGGEEEGRAGGRERKGKRIFEWVFKCMRQAQVEINIIQSCISTTLLCLKLLFKVGLTCVSGI